jgi:hypothetical protein
MSENIGDNAASAGNAVEGVTQGGVPDSGLPVAAPRPEPSPGYPADDGARVASQVGNPNPEPPGKGTIEQQEPGEQPAEAEELAPEVSPGEGPNPVSIGGVAEGERHSPLLRRVLGILRPPALSYLAPAFAIVVAAAGLGFGFWHYLEQRDRGSIESVALAWTTAISRLGIEPIYPPQEGIAVGDVFLVISTPPKEIQDQIPDYPAGVFTGRGIKIAHIDELSSSPEPQGDLVFADTAFNSEGKVDLQQQVKLVRLSDGDGTSFTCQPDVVS